MKVSKTQIFPICLIECLYMCTKRQMIDILLRWHVEKWMEGPLRPLNSVHFLAEIALEVRYK